MHAYLKTIGFSKIKTTKELQEILRDVVENYDRKKIVETEEHHLFAEFSKEYAYDCGITVCGEIDENNRFQMEYYYPYFEGGQISSYEEGKGSANLRQIRGCLPREGRPEPSCRNLRICRRLAEPLPVPVQARLGMHLQSARSGYR